jgi:hypothetical protein
MLDGVGRGGCVVWGWRRTGVVTACMAMLAALAGGVLLWSAWARPAQPPSPPDVGSAPAARASTASTASTAPRASGRQVSGNPVARPRGVKDRTRGLVLPESAPTRVSIPRLHVRARLVRLGVDSTGAMQVPADPARPGWFDLGPTPGALGPAVIAGHVTWNRSPAVFFGLATLRRGDHVLVDRADGRTTVFAVRRIPRFDKARFPTRQVFGAINHAGLRLITCGGRYDAAAHRYLANVVVFATLVGSRPGT